MNYLIFKQKQIPSHGLSRLVYETLDNFPILREVYDDEFVTQLALKNHGKNYLLWLLAAKNEYTFNQWSQIAESLELLREYGGIEAFRYKLRSPTEIEFSNYFVELHFAAYFKKRGYEITLEPTINEAGNNCDFMLEYNGSKIYFEAKNLHYGVIIEQEKFDYELHSDLRITEINLVYSVRRMANVTASDYQGFKRFVEQELRANKDAEQLPITIQYENDESEVIAELTIHGHPESLDHGFLGAVADLKASLWEDREKIMSAVSSKTRQLVQGERNVVIVNSNDIMTDYISIQDALFGEDGYKIIRETGELIPIRTGDRIFTHHKNTRISAVLFSELKRNDGFIVFHNPYAEKPIPVEFFEAENVKQFAITKHTDKEMILDWI